jgi:very-short-patch-repair endonuclease
MLQFHVQRGGRNMVEGAEDRCLRLAAKQSGLLCRRQALAHGLTGNQIEWKLATQRWVLLHPGVYRVEGSQADWAQQLRGACLWAGPQHALSHRTAAALWGLARFREGPIEISVTRNIRLPVPVVVHRVRPFHSADRVTYRDFAVTSPARTLIDLCGIADAPTLRASADEFLRRRLLTLERLEAALGRSIGHRGIAGLKELAQRYAGGEQATESELEAVALDAIDAAGLPRPQKQAPIHAGGRLRRVDFLYPTERIIIEADSRLYHGDSSAFERDRERRNALTLRGYCVLQWTWKALSERPELLTAQLGQALARAQQRRSAG